MLSTGKSTISTDHFLCRKVLVYQKVPFGKLTVRPCQIGVGRLVSTINSSFSGSMLIYQKVTNATEIEVLQSVATPIYPLRAKNHVEDLRTPRLVLLWHLQTGPKKMSTSGHIRRKSVAGALLPKMMIWKRNFSHGNEILEKRGSGGKMCIFEGSCIECIECMFDALHRFPY